MDPRDGSSDCPVDAYVAAVLTLGGATRAQLLWAAMNTWAPKPVVDALLALPDGWYRDLDDVHQHLDAA